MATLSEALSEPSRKPAVVSDCLTLIDQEVADKGGFSGLAIKAGYAAVKNIRPGFLKHVVEELVPQFAKALEVVYADAKAKGPSVSSFFSSNSSRVADALLSITDEKAQRASGLVKKTYD